MIRQPESAYLLPREEEYLYVNAVRTLMAYIDTKVADAAPRPGVDGG